MSPCCCRFPYMATMCSPQYLRGFAGAQPRGVRFPWGLWWMVKLTQKEWASILDFHVRCLEEVKNIIPNGGLMVSYHRKKFHKKSHLNLRKIQVLESAWISDLVVFWVGGSKISPTWSHKKLGDQNQGVTLGIKHLGWSTHIHAVNISTKKCPATVACLFVDCFFFGKQHGATSFFSLPKPNLFVLLCFVFF